MPSRVKAAGVLHVTRFTVMLWHWIYTAKENRRWPSGKLDAGKRQSKLQHPMFRCFLVAPPILRCFAVLLRPLTADMKALVAINRARGTLWQWLWLQKRMIEMGIVYFTKCTIPTNQNISSIQCSSPSFHWRGYCKIQIQVHLKLRWAAQQGQRNHRFLREKHDRSMLKMHSHGYKKNYVARLFGQLL